MLGFVSLELVAILLERFQTLAGRLEGGALANYSLYVGLLVNVLRASIAQGSNYFNL